MYVLPLLCFTHPFCVMIVVADRKTKVRTYIERKAEEEGIEL